MSKSPNAVKADFEQRGVTIADWAEHRGFSRALVYAVLAGRKRCIRGESHRIAVALGIKRPPQESA